MSTPTRRSIADTIFGTTRVLVTGATGQQGGATVNALLAKGGFEVYALSRTPSSPSALALEEKGVKVVQGDFTDKESLEAVLREYKFSQVFLITDFWQSAKQKHDVEVLHGVNMVDAVKAVDPSIFVLYTSVGDADKVPATVQHFCSKARVEEHLAATLTKWAVLRPTSFLENFDAPAMMNPLKKGKVNGITPPDLKMKYVSTIDIGKAAANILSSPSKYRGMKMELATCEHTGLEIAEALSEASGTKCVYGVNPPVFVMRLLIPDLYAMLKWFESDNYSADVAKGKALVGPEAMDAKAWFAQKGQWSNGVKFGEEEPEGESSKGKAVAAVAVAMLAVAMWYFSG